MSQLRQDLASFAYESRQQTAFRWSCDELFEVSKRVYFWTFTLVDAMPSWWVGPTWSKLLDWMAQKFGRFQGLRVFEWHKNHGLHVHMLCNRRLPVASIRRYAKRLGFGRINVKRANYGGALYLRKYLGKDAGKIPHSGRAWQRIGGVGCAKNAIEYHSPSLTQRKRRAAVLRGEGKHSLTAWEQATREEQEDFIAEARQAWAEAVPNPF